MQKVEEYRVHLVYVYRVFGRLVPKHAEGVTERPHTAVSTMITVAATSVDEIEKDKEKLAWIEIKKHNKIGNVKLIDVSVNVQGAEAVAPVGGMVALR